MRHLLLTAFTAAILAVLGSCASCDRRPSQTDVYLADVPFGHVGYIYYGSGSQNHQVLIDPDYYRDAPTEFVITIIAHELMHAAGHHAHQEDPTCVIYKNAHPLPEKPCPPELEWLRTRARFQVVCVKDPILYDDVRYAAFWLNLHAGRTIFEVRP